MVVRRAEVASPIAGKTQATHEGFYDELEASKRKKSCLSFRNCGCALFVFVFICFLAGAALFAASGLARVPVFSDLFYRTPQPTRFVEPVGSLSFNKFIQDQIKLSQVIPDAAGAVSVAITEGQITSMLQSPGADGKVFLKQGQISIDPDSMEIFGQLALEEGQQPISIKAVFKPTSDGQLLEVVSAQVGNVPIASKLLGTVADLILGRSPIAGRDLGQFGITGIQLAQGQLTLQVDPTYFTEVDPNPNTVPSTE